MKLRASGRVAIGSVRRFSSPWSLGFTTQYFRPVEVRQQNEQAHHLELSSDANWAGQAVFALSAQS